MRSCGRPAGIEDTLTLRPEGVILALLEVRIEPVEGQALEISQNGA